MIPLGDEVTLPGPFLLTERRYLARPKVAVTLRARFIDTVHVGVVPLHTPDHRAKVEPASGVARSVTEVLFAKNALQVGPQSMPAGRDVTVPEPCPALLTWSWCGASTWQSSPDGVLLVAAAGTCVPAASCVVVC